MPLNRRSKVKEAWRHPVGHEMMVAMLRQTGRGERWLENPLIANMTLQRLDRFAGAGFADTLVEMTAREPAIPVPPVAQQAAWWKEAVVYQIYLPSFMDSDHDGMGDIGGVSSRLPYLEKLGADVIWLWAPLEAAGQPGGVRDFRQVSGDYGGNAALKQLVQSAHARGMRVVMGVDITASSDEHPWFAGALKGEGADTYFLRPGVPGTPPNNWARASSGSVWTWYGEAGVWALHIAGRHKMDLNWDNPAVRAEMADVLRYWTDVGIDGFCFEQVGLLSKGSFEDGSPTVAALTGIYGFEKFAFGPRMHRYLKELRAGMGNKDVLVLGETRGVGPGMAKMFAACERRELDMVYDSGHLSWRGRTQPDEEGFDLYELKRYYLNWMQQYGAECWMSLFLETPDTPRMVSRIAAGPEYRCLLAKLLGTLLMTMRGTPVIYQGEEIGMPNTRFSSVEELRDAASLRLYADVRERMGEAAAQQWMLRHAADHARTPMPWNTSAGSGFTGAKPWMRLSDCGERLNVASQMEDGHSVWNHYRRLIELRKGAPCLVYGGFNPVFVKSKRVFCYFRILDGHKWYVEMNLTEKQVVRPGRLTPSHKLMLSNYDSEARMLRPYEANLYRCD